MRIRKHNSAQRSNRFGSTLAELLVATILLVFVAAGLVGLVVVNNSQSQRLLNKVDGINAGKMAIERIGRNVRIGRSVGDVYGALPAPASPILDLGGALNGILDLGGVLDLVGLGIPELENGTATYSAASFPSNGDPSWGNQQIPNGGWPWTTLAFPYVLSSQTLIIQVPVFDAHGYPLVQKGTVVNWESVDTYVYQVLPDPASSGQFMIQVAGFPGAGSSMSATAVPQTILRGISGPLNPDGSIGVFHYISADKSGVMQDTVADSEVANVSGVVLTLEILNSTSGPEPSTISLKDEFYLRNNDQATVLGQ